MTMNIKMFDTVAHYERDREAIDAAVREVFATGRFVMGPQVRQFEEAFAAYCGVGYAAGVMSGTSALLMALKAVGVGPGDEVITVANSDIPTSHAITHTGAQVVWVDIDRDNYNMDPEKLEAAITPRTKVVLPVHLYGIPADMDPINEIARRHHLLVMEDGALAAGATYRGRRVGALGDIAAFSTAPGKILAGAGSGGVVTTDNKHFYERLNVYRHYGREGTPYWDEIKKDPGDPTKTLEIGYNERLDTIDAAVLLIRLPHLDADLVKRRRIAAVYERLLEETPVRIPRPPAGSEPAWRVYTVSIQNRDDVYRQLAPQGLGVTLQYLPANHLDVCYRDLGYREGSLPHTEAACRELLSLPCHQYMSEADAEAVAGALLKLV